MRSAQPSAFRGARERGQAVLLLLALLGALATVFAFGMVAGSASSVRREQNTVAAFAQVKQALIGWSVSRDPAVAGQPATARPGELPCPDTNPLDGYEDGSCAAGAIGRVPWKTLGIPEPKDEAGETLWYAIAGSFRIWNMSPVPINSDTRGNLVVYWNSTATPLTTEAVAVIFAPGPALAGQLRDASAAPCPTTGTTIARNLCAANYLEGTGGANNAAIGGPFVAALTSASFNDRLLAITAADLVPAVEQRVAQELRRILQAYKAGNACACINLGGKPGCYPWADLSDGRSDAAPYTPGSERNRGRIPVFGAAPYDWGASPCGTPLPTLPAWFANNEWRRVVYYSAARDVLGPNTQPCATCVDPSLSVNGIPGTEALILTPGPIAGPPPRAPVPLDDPNYWKFYFEDAANSDFADDLYVVPGTSAHARNRIFTIP